MESTNKTMLRVLFWVVNVVIAGIAIFFMVIASFTLGKVHINFTEVSNSMKAGNPFTMIFVPFFIRFVYLAGLVYILASLNIMVYKVLKGHVYERGHLRYIRRIGYLLLLAPVPMLLFSLVYLPGGARAGMGVMLFLDGIANNWPYSIIGLVVLAIAEVYKVGVAYKQELDLTV